MTTVKQLIKHKPLRKQGKMKRTTEKEKLTSKNTTKTK